MMFEEETLIFGFLMVNAVAIRFGWRIYSNRAARAPSNPLCRAWMYWIYLVPLIAVFSFCLPALAALFPLVSPRGRFEWLHLAILTVIPCALWISPAIVPAFLRARKRGGG
jgi:hypothetical protein